MEARVLYTRHDRNYRLVLVVVVVEDGGIEEEGFMKLTFHGARVLSLPARLDVKEAVELSLAEYRRTRVKTVVSEVTVPYKMMGRGVIVPLADIVVDAPKPPAIDVGGFSPVLVESVVL